MPTRKIVELTPSAASCRHPEHDPPKHCAFSPGLYEHTCPACRVRQTFLVGPGAMLSSPR